MNNETNYYDEIAQGYNELHREEQLRKIAIIRKFITKNSLILDVGCGSGISQVLGNVIGIDPSRELLKQSIFPVVQGIGEFLPFKDGSFDCVISITALHHCKNIKKALTEIRRVGKGSVVLSILKKSNQFEKIREEVEHMFFVKNIVEDPTDLIFILEKEG